MKTRFRILLGLGCLLLAGCNNADNTARPPLPSPAPKTAAELPVAP